MKARQPLGEKKMEWLEARRLEGHRVLVSEDLQAACLSASRFLLHTSRHETPHMEC